MNFRTGGEQVDELLCRRCGEPTPGERLDRQLWCERCVLESRNYASRWGRVFGMVGAAILAVWVAVDIAPSGVLLVGWGVIVIVAYRILGRLGRELVLGGIRAGLIQARPPGSSPNHPE